MDLRPWLVVLAACSGGKSKTVASAEDARAGGHADHPADHVIDAAIARDPGPPGKGDVAIRVEWHDVPVDARTPKRCGPDVAPTTTWGIPDAVVSIAVPAGSQSGPGAAPARVVIGTCIAPRVQVAGDSLVIASGMMTPVAVTLDDRKVELPIAGHEVATALAPGRHAIVAGDAHAWVVSAPWSAVTEGSGVATLRDVPTGTYGVTAWLPTANRTAKGEVTVTAGALADVTLQL